MARARPCPPALRLQPAAAVAAHGRVLAFEVKANEQVNGRDLKGLRTLPGALGDRLMAGIAFITGPRSDTHEDLIHVKPVYRLWRTVP